MPLCVFHPLCFGMKSVCDGVWEGLHSSLDSLLLLELSNTARSAAEVDMIMFVVGVAGLVVVVIVLVMFSITLLPYLRIHSSLASACLSLSVRGRGFCFARLGFFRCGFCFVYAWFEKNRR